MPVATLIKRDIGLFGLTFAFILLLHIPLLNLPYFWDEAGHYIPAARDLMLSGDVIPRTTISNAHPPLPMFYLALAWLVFGYVPIVTRVAMLFVAAFGLLQIFRITERVANREVAVAATVCTALYPVFFAQSSLAHADLMATALALWGLRLYIEEKRWMSLFAFSVAALSKETAIVFPLALCCWEIFKNVTSGAKAPYFSKVNGAAKAAPLQSKFDDHLGAASLQSKLDDPLGAASLQSKLDDHLGTAPLQSKANNQGKAAPLQNRTASTLLLLTVPTLSLAFWFAYHYSRTGYVFGNPEFFRYNVGATLEPLRILLAAMRRVWQVTGYMNLWVLTVSMAAAMMLPPLVDNGQPRPRIPIPTQLLFLSLILAHIVGHSLVGGAVLARYMMPVVPLVIILSVSTLWRRVRLWKWLVGFSCATFVIGWIVPPLASFAPEDNLNYASYVRLHQKAAKFIEARYPRSTVLTAWTASDELTHPYLGYVQKPVKVVRIENFSSEQLTLAQQNGDYDVALLFSTKTPRSRYFRWQLWEKANQRHFDLHEDVPPALAATMLNGRMVMQESENGQWVAVVEVNRARDAD